MFTSLWTIFRRIAGNNSYKVQEPNPVLNVGVFNEVMSSQKQVPFLIGVSKIEKSDIYDSSLSKETGKGSIYVPYTEDFYTGEAL